jgi:hypothetical protein
MKAKTHHYLFSVCCAALTFAADVLLSPAAAQARTISETLKVGVYSVTLKVFVPPADLFNGPDSMTVCEGVAEANRVSGCINCFLEVFVEENGKSEDHAKVTISYRKLSPKAGPWRELRVARWRISPQAKTLVETPQATFFGNDVELPSGRYEARVAVNGCGPATFRFSLHR